MKLSEAIARYVELRDDVSQRKKAFEADVAVLKEEMDGIENKVLKLMLKSGANSLKTETGTAYQTTRNSATVADKDIFRQFCLDNNEWTLADIRASKAGVEQYMEANEGVLPPGITWRSELAVNFRR